MNISSADCVFYFFKQKAAYDMRISDWSSGVCSSDLSVGVAPQYASALGKNANCQTLVSVTLASREVPIMLGLLLFLPESWTSDEARMVKAGVPEPFRPYRTKPAIAIEEIDRVIAAGVRFGCVLADAGYEIGRAHV